MDQFSGLFLLMHNFFSFLVTILVTIFTTTTDFQIHLKSIANTFFCVNQTLKMLENKLDRIWNVKYFIKWNKIFEGTIFCTKAHNFVLTKVNTNRFFFCSFLKFHSCKVLQKSLFCCVYLKTFSHLFCDHFWNSLIHGLKK